MCLNSRRKFFPLKLNDLRLHLQLTEGFCSGICRCCGTRTRSCWTPPTDGPCTPRARSTFWTCTTSSRRILATTGNWLITASIELIVERKWNHFSMLKASDNRNFAAKLIESRTVMNRIRVQVINQRLFALSRLTAALRTMHSAAPRSTSRCLAGRARQSSCRPPTVASWTATTWHSRLSRCPNWTKSNCCTAN